MSKTYAEQQEEIKAAESKLDQMRKDVHETWLREQRERPLLERLTFAATARCPCGAGLPYDPAEEGGDGPFCGPSAWDCSAILLGTAIPNGRPGSVTHTDKLPFAFYEIKSENQPSAFGATTRPKS